METFTLVAWFWLMGPRGGDVADMRVPGLTEAECKMRAKEIAAPQPRIGGAYCEIEGRPAPAWTPPTSYTLVTSIYAGGGRTEWTRTPGLSENLCKAWAADVVLRARGSAYCKGASSPPVCADCRTLKERGLGPA